MKDRLRQPFSEVAKHPKSLYQRTVAIRLSEFAGLGSKRFLNASTRDKKWYGLNVAISGIQSDSIFLRFY